MGQRIEIEERLTIKFCCDYCGKQIENNKKPVFVCVICKREICKTCKRHIHVEVGSGNGKAAFKWELNHTNNYCPGCAESKIREVYALLEVPIPGEISR